MQHTEVTIIANEKGDEISKSSKTKTKGKLLTYFIFFFFNFIQNFLHTILSYRHLTSRLLL